MNIKILLEKFPKLELRELHAQKLGQRSKEIESRKIIIESIDYETSLSYRSIDVLCDDTKKVMERRR